MELNVWTSTTVSHVEREESTGLFKVKVQHKKKGSERIFTVKHVVLAPGFSGGSWYTPTYPGMVLQTFNCFLRVLTLTLGQIQRTNYSLVGIQES